MKTLMKWTTAAAVVLGTITGNVATAAAAVQYVGGGTWEYGTGGGKVYSDYYHAAVKHGSSVRGKSGLVQSPCVSPGEWARVSDNTKFFGRNESFWRHC
ncbi:lactococcin 972 family bacteriocin [Corynebacterium bovis]|uniref:lactococcin 972 family bacteriocin n=1 Tax=Corynebacterium bovis TaxID=36808 RepID=UPI00244B225B|nr:lactococcin 972 family bacteriocin [Corynebacterium bovis]MDH2456677.1 lactococcin 972 family bacteriocin [Corynebacterium bovis]